MHEFNAFARAPSKTTVYIIIIFQKYSKIFFIHIYKLEDFLVSSLLYSKTCPFIKIKEYETI